MTWTKTGNIRGPQGAQGPAGQGVPAGGAINTFLQKKTAADYDTQWAASSALPADTVVVAGTRIIANKLLAGDAQPSFRFFGDGKHEWGPGGAGAVDTNLYRSQAGVLRTDQVLCSATSVIANQGLANQLQMNSDGRIYFGSANDTYLYRSAAGVLATAASIVASGTITAGGRFISGAASTGGIYVDGAAASQFIGSVDANNIGIYHGAQSFLWKFRNDGYMTIGDDCYLRKMSAQNLHVGETLRVNTNLVVGQSGAQAYIYFGNVLDVSLFRQTGGQLRTAGLFLADNDIYANWSTANQVVLYHNRGVPEIIFGQPNDCSLYRSSSHWINHYSADGAWGGFQAAVFSVQSDRKTKSEIERAEVPVERMLDVGVYTYRRDKWPGRHLGLIADELPDELTVDGQTTEGEQLKFVDLYKLSAALLATVQHLNDRLKALEGSV